MRFVLLILLATVVPASAQQAWGNPPRTVTYTNKATGEKIGTAIVSRSMVVLRDKHDTHYATIILGPNGTRKWVDPHGNPIDPKTTLLPLE